MVLKASFHMPAQHYFVALKAPIKMRKHSKSRKHLAKWEPGDCGG